VRTPIPTLTLPVKGREEGKKNSGTSCVASLRRAEGKRSENKNRFGKKMKEPTAQITPLPQFQRVHQQRFTIEYDYPVYFTERVFGIGNAAFCEALSRKEPNKRHRFVVFVDENVAAYRPDLLGDITAYAQHYAQKLELVATPELVPGGEPVKNDPQLVERLQRRLLDLGIDRHSYVVGIGGGAMLDLIGYVAGTSHRGVRHIRVPTTVLAQNDSGVGVKNGVNAFGVKNFLGTFAPPFAVADGVRCIPTGGLSRLARPAGRFTVIGAGKTALDTCVWLLERGVDPDARRIPLTQDPAPPGDDHREGHRLRGTEPGGHGAVERRRVDTGGPRGPGDHVPHGPGRGRGRGQVGLDDRGREVDRVPSDGEGDAALAAEAPGDPGDTAREPEPYFLSGAVDDRIHHGAPEFHRPREESDVGGGIGRVEPGQEDRRAQRLRETRRMVFEGIAGRRNPDPRELVLLAPGDEGRPPLGGTGRGLLSHG